MIKVTNHHSKCCFIFIVWTLKCILLIWPKKRVEEWGEQRNPRGEKDIQLLSLLFFSCRKPLPFNTKSLVFVDRVLVSLFSKFVSCLSSPSCTILPQRTPTVTTTPSTSTHHHRYFPENALSIQQVSWVGMFMDPGLPLTQPDPILLGWFF